MKVCFLQQQYEIIYKHPYVYVDGIRGDLLENTIWNTLYNASVYANIHLFIMNIAFSQYIIEQAHNFVKHEHFDLDIQLVRSDAGPVFRIALEFYDIDLRIPNPQAPFSGIPYCLRFQPNHPMHLTPIFDDYHMSYIQPFLNRLQFWHSIVDKHWTEEAYLFLAWMYINQPWGSYHRTMLKALLSEEPVVTRQKLQQALRFMFKFSSDE